MIGYMGSAAEALAKAKQVAAYGIGYEQAIRNSMAVGRKIATQGTTPVMPGPSPSLASQGTRAADPNASASSGGIPRAAIIGGAALAGLLVVVVVAKKMKK
jgi:hypothetical protein